MREIKFRARIINSKDEKHDYNGIWVYGYVVEVMGLPVSKWYIHQLSDWNLNTKFEVDPQTVGESTGLKDKNGKEIYEGDIVKSINPDPEESEIGEVSFEFSSFGVKDIHEVHFAELIGFTWVGNGTSERYMGNIPNIEIIGNIYENSQLLK